MKPHFVVFLPILLLILFSCSKISETKQTLESAGANRSELEKVLNHYKQLGNNKKLKAAEFLIKYMGYGKYSYEGEFIAHYDTIVSIFDSLRNSGIIVGDPPVVKNAWNRINHQYGLINKSELNPKMDNKSLHSDFLIKNIDIAFADWESSAFYNPDNINLFYEYILPHRVMHEQVEAFRPYYNNKYKSLTDTVKCVKELVHAFKNQLYWVEQYRTSALLWDYPLEFSIKQMERSHRGSCRQLAPWMTLILRACGYAATIDRAVWANRSQGHMWNIVYLKNGDYYPFNTLEDTIEFAYKPAKIFRKTYSYDLNLFEELNSNDIPMSLIQLDEKDVTHEYVKAFDVIVPIQFSSIFNKKKKHAVICVFDDRNWRIVYWGKIKSGKMFFKNMASDVAYIGAYYDKGKIIPATEPFVLQANGQVKFCTINTVKTITLKLDRKFPRFKRIEDHAWGVRRANAEASNNSQFKDSVCFFSVYDIPFHVADSLVNDKRKFRYIRFNSSTYRNANFAEVEFYGKKKETEEEQKLTGKIIGFPNIEADDEHPFTHAMDGNLETYFSKPKNTVGWVGLDLGKGNERILTRVRFCPRSDTNFILQGDTYELLYWNGKGWQSYEKKRAVNFNTIEFEDVPSGAFYLLRNLSGGLEERIFTYEKGKQVWW